MRKATRIGALATGALALASTVALRAQDAPGGGPTAVEVADEGRDVYEQICQACHMADAKGGGTPGAMIPALAGNPRLADKDYGTIILLKGRGGMPWFSDMLTNEQMAAALTYVRSHFNDYKDPVTVADFERVKDASPPVPDCNCSQ
ncbi:cytochrome c [Novosphingobium sp. SL115]|uniref:c-type cytochrome n=1 Tax=Novosphingobium sp. SL115 TaxID=2995150 RepID=UPI002275DA5B|nr:cytochrome c [Novosphingobium sp. SL115]MCY1672978.1 cytochrome c [Novosphingobium sp. SL115]